MSEIQVGTAVALVSEREVMKGRVRRPPRHGKASVYWVRRGRASSVHLTSLVPIDDAELVAFFEQQEALYQEAWQNIMNDDARSSLAVITPPAVQPEHVQAFIRTGAADGDPLR